MEINKADVLTPANALSTLGLALTVAGAANIDRVSGVAMIGAGRVLDLADGYVARRTHASEFGAAVDATFDKLAVAALVIQSARHDAVPLGVLGVIVASNVINAASNLYIQKKGGEPKTSKEGKFGMFGQNLTIGGFALANALGGNNALEVASYVTFGGSNLFAASASYNYAKQALVARQQTSTKTPKSHHRQKR